MAFKGLPLFFDMAENSAQNIAYPSLDSLL